MRAEAALTVAQPPTCWLWLARGAPKVDILVARTNCSALPHGNRTDPPLQALALFLSLEGRSKC
jgi:hypothetical protein